MLFLHPQPSDGALEQAYRTHYYVPGDARAAVYENTPPALAAQVLQCLLARKVLPGTGARLLDVGCGFGDFAAAAGRAGLDGDAIEPDPVARGVAQRRGLAVYSSLAAIPLARRADGYDLIALLDVLEHAREPGLLLAQLRELLRPSGRLYLSVPNYRAPQARLLGARWDQVTNPTHLFLFSTRSLAHALAAVGLRFHYFPCVLRDPRFSPGAGLVSRFLQRVRLSATLRVLAAPR